jgi:hypothetical protein
MEERRPVAIKQMRACCEPVRCYRRLVSVSMGASSLWFADHRQLTQLLLPMGKVNLQTVCRCRLGSGLLHQASCHLRPRRSVRLHRVYSNCLIHQSHQNRSLPMTPTILKRRMKNPTIGYPTST